MSRIGKKPVELPAGTKIEIADTKVAVQGPKGKIDRIIHKRIKVELKGSQVIVSRKSDSNLDKSLHGLTRSLIANMVKGVTDGFSKELEIRGVGYRAQTQDNNLTMQLGFSHPVVYAIPEGISIETPKPTQLIVKGIDKEKVGATAAKIRKFRPPEPYKGTGIRYKDEYVRHKVGKAVA